MRNVFVLAAAVVVLVALLIPWSPANPAAQGKGQQWEYKVVSLDDLVAVESGGTKEGRAKQAGAASTTYSALGAEGWELTDHIPHYGHAVFKRKK